jgi:8-oxo-dGTP pyrophosphatase MutT (NUDIX family)
MIREAATVMLVRDNPDLHVFMLRRNLESRFVAGASVFPGGAVDPDDRAAALVERCHGRTDAEASLQVGVPSGGLGFWVAAIREAFEEAGVLLARHAATGDPIDLTDAGAAARLEATRPRVAGGAKPFLDVVVDEDLLLDVGALHLFAHWITPPGAPRRYDTWFFVAEAPVGHAYLHDDDETIASEWVRPADALARAEAGELELIFPTMRSLAVLSKYQSAGALLADVRAAAAVAPIRMVRDFNGQRVALPGDPADAEGVA